MYGDRDRVKQADFLNSAAPMKRLDHKQDAGNPAT